MSLKKVQGLTVNTQFCHKVVWSLKFVISGLVFFKHSNLIVCLVVQLSFESFLSEKLISQICLIPHLDILHDMWFQCVVFNILIEVVCLNCVP